MEDYNIYNDISERSQGDVYIGVVGPVRTGKSTFIKRFMDTVVIPNITNEYIKERAVDELPQSAEGKTIMTTEPKFVPNDAVEISLGDNAHLRVRMIDCVGYVVPSSLGYFEENEPRMVHTPWSDEPMPFDEAAKIGTKKVINEHSTIGIVITTDGTVTDIPRSDYVDAEKRVISELKAINKPFIVLLNSVSPDSYNTKTLAAQMEAQYSVPVMPINCAELDADDINSIIENVLFEFPLTEICISTPDWIKNISPNHKLVQDINNLIISNTEGVDKIRDTKELADKINSADFIENAYIEGMDLGKGTVNICVNLSDELFYSVLSEETGFDVSSREEMIALLCDLAKMNEEYSRVKDAINQVYSTGYGVVYPTPDEMALDEPKIVKQGGKFGVKLKASAPSIHMMRAQIETEVSPIVGTEKQSEDLINYLMSEFETDPQKIWDSNIFGKSLYDLVNEGLNAKLSKMPDEARNKLRDTLERIINEGSGGLICIIL